MIRLSTFLCIVLFSQCSTTFGAKVDDVLLELSQLGPRASLLIKNGFPIDTIPVDTMRTEQAKPKNSKKRSVFYKNSIDSQHQHHDYVEPIRSSILTEKVDKPLKNMKTMINKYLDLEQYKSEEFNQTFRSSCERWNKNSPDSILRSMHLMFVQSCKNFVTPTEVQEFADHRTFLMRLFTRLQVENETIPDPGLYLADFFVAYELLGDYKKRDVLNEDLDVYKRTFPSYEKAVRALFKELETRASISIVADPCPLRAKILASFFKYSLIEAYATNLINQLTELTFIARTCAHSLYEGNTESIDKYTNPVVGKVSDISMHTAEFFNVSLILAWPSAHNQLLKEQIMRNVRKEGFVDDKNLKTVTEITRPLLMNTGLPNYAFEMLIVRATEKEYDLYFEGFDRYYSLRKNVSGFDTIIGRIPINSTNLQNKLKITGRMAHLNNVAYDLNATIQFEMDKLYNAPTLPVIAAELKKKIGTQFISRDNFHCWAILREWAPKFWSSCPTIDYFLSSYNVSDMSSITTLSYTNRGNIFQKCEEFRFLFFM